MTYDVVLADPPWAHYGSPDKWAAAGKFYPLMPDDDVFRLPVLRLLHARSIVYLWATCPRLDVALQALEAWGLHYRGVAFVWVKTRRDGRPIGAQGVRPSIVKPLVELVVAGSPQRRGRPLPVLDESVQQTIFAPRGAHSAKPPAVRAAIERLHGEARRIELFAREQCPGWDAWGDEIPSVDIYAGAT